jgi:cell wall-associated NlpC family hydrolase
MNSGSPSKDELRCYVENAVTWVKGRLGSEEYRFRCLAFVEDAYEMSNNIEIFGGDTAKESADQYGVINREGVPPAGVFVFYDCWGTLKGRYKNWGHVGLSTGDGNVIHAWNVVRIDDYLDLENITPAPGWTQPRYIGWAPVERIFQGYRKLCSTNETDENDR